MLQRNCPETDMPLTLEQHFKMLASPYLDVENLYSLWLLLRIDLEDRLPHSRAVFVHYSLHDATHSRSVIRAVERFLGDKRIDRLSATDTFMLLVCAYAHDYGMAMTFNQIYDSLGEPDFVDFIKKQLEISYTLNEEDIKALQNLRDYIEENRTNSTLQEQYFCIMLVIQMYLRPTGGAHLGRFQGAAGWPPEREVYPGRRGDY